MFDLARQPTTLHSAYPERALPRYGWLDRQGERLASPFLRWRQVRRSAWTGVVTAVNEAGRELAALPDEGLRARAAELRERLRRDGLAREQVVRTFALVREVARRTIGQRPFDVQVLGGWVLLSGCVTEMATGEGKTLTATLPASAAALAGVPVHIITVNDYLTARDAAAMRPVYAMLGLTVGAITHGMDPAARRAAYACDVTYCTNKELAFDYLRDRLAAGRQPNRVQLQLERLYGGARLRRLVLRGLCFGIVDEADSVLIDEARVPLVISGKGEVPERQIYETALTLGRELSPGTDFVVDWRERTVALTDGGRSRLAGRAPDLGGIWAGPRRREELVRQALTALHLFERDAHYLVQDQKVRIVDEYTGRVLGDRSWEQGLHQMIELKEGCPLTALQASLGRITYQRFFRRYLWLAGMTGTASEVAGELWNVYRLATVRIPTNRPVRRRWDGESLFASTEAKWDAVVRRISALHREGRPVLVGTRSVAASEHLSGLLTAAQVPHQVLNARQNREEAEIVAGAGELGRVTVATNMAGRGTDIRLGPGVAELGGLHVMATERHEAGRIDRQLFGRCARQGDPGSCESFTALTDEVMAKAGRALWRGLTRLATTDTRPLRGRSAAFLMRRAQVSAERLHARIRRELLRSEDQLDTALAFSGRPE